MITERLLAQLDNVRRSGNGWRADCPIGHSSRGALSVSDGDDGRVLLHCFAGCGAAEVVAALGLTLADLYPQPHCLPPMLRATARAAIRDSGWRAALGVLGRESLIVLIAACEMQGGLPPTAEDIRRLVLAVERIQSVREVLTP